MKVCVGADNAGFEGKKVVLEVLANRGVDLIDVGTTANEAVDFPDVAEAVCRQVLAGNVQRGILVCGTGIGACIAANKVHGIRAALAHDIHSAHQSVEHDDANILCLGSKIVGPWLLPELVGAFLDARWSESEEHRRRVAKLARLEAISIIDRG